MKQFLFGFLLLAMVTSCSKKGDENPRDTVQDFQVHLTASMTYDQIVSHFGLPDADKGSGIHIYVYKLKDETEICIGYTDRILYARHLDQNGMLLQVLI